MPHSEVSRRQLKITEGRREKQTKANFHFTSSCSLHYLQSVHGQISASGRTAEGGRKSSSDDLDLAEVAASLRGLITSLSRRGKCVKSYAPRFISLRAHKKRTAQVQRIWDRDVELSSTGVGGRKKP